MSEEKPVTVETATQNPVAEPKVPAVAEPKDAPASTTPEEKKEDVPKEEDKILEKSKDEMNLLEVVVHYLGTEKAEIPLTPQTEKLLKQLPAVDKKHLENVEGFFNEIIEDKQINMKDLPHLIGLLQELFLMYDSLRLKASAKDVSVIIKTLIQLLIMYKLENSDKLTKEQKDAILQSLDTVLELCIQMIDLKDAQKKCKKMLYFLPCF